MKLSYLAIAIFFTGMGLSGATPVLILGGIYFYAFFTYDANERKKEENRKSWLQNREREDKEKARIAKIRYDKGMAEIEKSKQERLQGIQKRQAEETERAIKRQQFSYVYVLSNSSMSGILKIGYTDNDPISRANELSNSTGVPTPYRVIREYPFATPSRAKAEEKRLHSVFKKQRVNLKREFFRVSVEEVESKVRGYIKDTEPQPTTITPKPKVEAIRTHTKGPELSINELAADMVERLLLTGIYYKKERPYLLPNVKNMLNSFFNSTMHKNAAHLKMYIDSKIRKLDFAGVFADEPRFHEKTHVYRYQCISCSRKFYTFELRPGALPCPHCFKEYNIKGSPTLYTI
jgi:DNA-directed RNA polymerase subunit RPC12/RpoP